MDSHTDGEEFRVPVICPKLAIDEWKSVGRILIKGYKDAKVYPMKLAEAFMIAVLFGEDTVTAQNLMESFSFFF